MYYQKYIKYKTKLLNAKMNQFGGGKKCIYIVRHGETDWNIEKKLQGCEADIELNTNGKNQAVITGKYLNEYRQKSTNFDVIYCSPLKRARETAEILAKELNYKGEIIVLDDLKEICVGQLSGSTQKERDELPKFAKLRELLNENVGDPIEKNKNVFLREEKISKIFGREPREELEKRVNNVLNIIKNDDNSKILLVTHNNLMSNFYMTIGNTLDPRDGNLSNGTNCKIGYIEYDGKQFKIITNPNTVHFGLYKN